MLFVIQHDPYDLDTLMIKNLILESKIHNFKEFDMSDIGNIEEIFKQPVDQRTMIPYGTLEFCGEFLKQYHGVEHLYPIEIPVSLRKYLRRDYAIVKGTDLPKTGRYFIKDAENLKHFSFSGDISTLKEYLKADNQKIKEDCHYVVSGIVNILSEYRVVVMDNKIAGINYYNGDPEILPDIVYLREIVKVYALDPGCPKAYTMDMMVQKTRFGIKVNDLLEIHPIMSCGLYSTVWGTDLLYGLRDGFEYYINCNKPCWI